MRAPAHHSQDTGAANPVRLDLTAWRLIDGRLLVTPHGAPAVIMDAPDFTPANFTNGHALETPAPRKALPAPRERKVKSPRKVVKKAAVKAAASKPRSTRPDEATVARWREAVRLHGLKGAATKLGVPYPTLYGRAKREGWMIGASAAETPAGEGTSRRCHACDQLTRSDPCHACKAPWKRTR